MTIIPICRRELVATAREGKTQSGRSAFGLMLFLALGGPLALWVYVGGRVLDAGTMARMVDEALRWGLAMQLAVPGSLITYGAAAIARERERRTLDFLLVTDLSSTEIILGKLAACMVLGLGMMAVGFPIMLLLHALGGVDLWLFGLIYPALAVSLLMFGALAIWLSVELPDRRLAGIASMLAMIAWMVGPFALSIFLPRFGIHPPRWMMTVNWWLTLASPVWIAFRVATGLREWDELAFELARMVALQFSWALVFLAAAILRLRPAHRALAGGDRKVKRAEHRRPTWRWRPRPPVGDEPILWREMYTTRLGGVLKTFMALIWGSLTIVLALATVRFAWPAFLELWRNGFATFRPSPVDPEKNILVRLFVGGPGAGAGLDAARIDFNLFLRSATVPILLMTSVVVAGTVGEVIGVERAKGTWASLLATPLGAREIIRQSIIAGIWRCRAAFLVVLILWGLGLASGAIHPLGCLVAWMLAAASVWLNSAVSVLESIRARNDRSAAGQGCGWSILLASTGAIVVNPVLGPQSILWGIGCLPLMLWTALVTHGEAAAALASPFAPGLYWLGPSVGEAPAALAVAWLLAILGPAAGGFWAWRTAVIHFDRLVGRPHRAGDFTQTEARTPFSARDLPSPRLHTSEAGSPLAEADRAV